MRVNQDRATVASSGVGSDMHVRARGSRVWLSPPQSCERSFGPKRPVDIPKDNLLGFCEQQRNIDHPNISVPFL